MRYRGKYATRQNVMEPKFPFIVYGNEMFQYSEKYDEWLQNLGLLLCGRKSHEIYFLSSNFVRLSNAHLNGFCIVPVMNTVSSQCVELHLVEKYLINLAFQERHLSHNIAFFKHLLEAPKKIPQNESAKSNTGFQMGDNMSLV